MKINKVIGREAGFTILEMIMSVLLLVIGTIAILSMFSIAIATDANIEKSTVALGLAQETMESIKDAGSWADLDNFVFPKANIGGDYSDFDREVTVSGDPKQVDVIVYWYARGEEQQIDLATLFSNYNY